MHCNIDILQDVCLKYPTAAGHTVHLINNIDPNHRDSCWVQFKTQDLYFKTVFMLTCNALLYLEALATDCNSWGPPMWPLEGRIIKEVWEVLDANVLHQLLGAAISGKLQCSPAWMSSVTYSCKNSNSTVSCCFEWLVMQGNTLSH